MLFKFIIPFCFVHHILSVKLTIDGTINLGPSWNFEYKLEQLRSFNNGNIVTITRDVTQESIEKLPNNFNAKLHVGSEERIIVDANNKTYEENKVKKEINIVDRDVNGYVARTAMNDEYDTNEKTEKTPQEDIHVTQLYNDDKPKSKATFDFETPRKIKEDKKLVEFILNINDTSVYVFDLVLEKADANLIKDKINELKKRFIEKFGRFINATKEHFIKTSLGVKKVVINVVDYSCNLMQRLANRFKIDAKDIEESTAKTFNEGIEKFRISGYKKACTQFSICRTGREYTDFVSDMMETILSADDKRIQQAVQAFAKELKKGNVSKIMDKKSERALKDTLSIIEEMSPIELKFLLTSYVFMIKSKNLPFSGQTTHYNWIQKGIATFKIIEVFDETIKMTEHNKHWGDGMKAKLEKWCKGKGENVTEIAKEFVRHLQEEGVDKVDLKTAKDLKSAFQTLMSSKWHHRVYNIPFLID